jgi:hypothetical protein
LRPPAQEDTQATKVVADHAVSGQHNDVLAAIGQFKPKYRQPGMNSCPRQQA